jgi:hypothetical protein
MRSLPDSANAKFPGESKGRQWLFAVLNDQQTALLRVEGED